MAAWLLDNDGNSFDGHEAPCVIPKESSPDEPLHTGVCFSIKGRCLGHDSAGLSLSRKE